MRLLPRRREGGREARPSARAASDAAQQAAALTPQPAGMGEEAAAGLRKTFRV